MSTAPAAQAGAPAAPAAAAAPPAKTKLETVPKDIRDRVLSGKTTPPPADPAAAAAKAKADKEAADKKTADEAAAKQKADDEAAKNNPPAARVKKAKDGPPLPAAPTDTRTVEQVVRDVVATTAAPAPGAPAAPTVDPEIQREIDLATFAERSNPERYTGMAGKVTGYFKLHEETVAAKAKELGGQKTQEFREWIESDEYRNFVAQNRPTYVRGDKAKLSDDMIAERAREETRREMQPELKALERKTAELEHAPRIRAKADHLLQKVVLTAPADAPDPALTGFAKDPLKFGEEHPVEAQLIANECQDAIDLIQEIYRIDLDLVPFDPKKLTPKQQKIREYTTQHNAELRALHPNGVEMTDGKILVDADTYQRLKLHNDPKYRTFSADEYAGMIAATRNAEVLNKLKVRREGVARSVYAPRAAGAPAAPAAQGGQAEDPPASPIAGVASAPGSRAAPPENQWDAARRKALTGK